MNKLAFADWLEQEIRNRGWSQNELARRSSITSSGVSQVLTRKTFAGPEFCRGVARALGMPPERVFRKAGLLPPHIIGERDQERKNELLDYYESLRDEDRDTAVALIRTLYEQRGPYAAELRPNDEED